MSQQYLVNNEVGGEIQKSCTQAEAPQPMTPTTSFSSRMIIPVIEREREITIAGVNQILLLRKVALGCFPSDFPPNLADVFCAGWAYGGPAVFRDYFQSANGFIVAGAQVSFVSTLLPAISCTAIDSGIGRPVSPLFFGSRAVLRYRVCRIRFRGHGIAVGSFPVTAVISAASKVG